MAAPDGVFQRDFALMLNVWRSWSLNQQMLRDRMQDAANKMRQTGEILRSAARGQSEAFDRANKGFSYYIRGVEVLEHTSVGRARQLRPRLRRRGGEGGPDQVPPGAAEPVPYNRLGDPSSKGFKRFVTDGWQVEYTAKGSDRMLLEGVERMFIADPCAG